MRLAKLAQGILGTQGRQQTGFHPLQSITCINEAQAALETAAQSLSNVHLNLLDHPNEPVVDDVATAVENLAHALIGAAGALQSLGVSPDTAVPFVRESVMNGAPLYLRQLVQVSVTMNGGAHLAPLVGTDSHGFKAEVPKKLEPFDRDDSVTEGETP